MDLKQKLAQISEQLYYWKGHEWAIHRPDDKTLLKQHLEVTPVLLAVIDKLIEQRDNASACYYERLYGEAIEGKTEMDRDKQGEDAELLEILERGK